MAAGTENMWWLGMWSRGNIENLGGLFLNRNILEYTKVISIGISVKMMDEGRESKIHPNDVAKEIKNIDTWVL